jgi:hypothetical protein
LGPANLEFDVALILSTAMTVVFNSYVGSPLMQSQFGEWLRMDRTVEGNDWFKFLDIGLTKEGRMLVLIVWTLFTIFTGFFGIIR